MEIFRVFATLGLDRGEFESGLNAAEDRLQAIGTAFTNAGRTMTLGITTPIVGFGTAALIAAGNFEQAMNQVAAVSGATGEEIAALEDIAKHLGATTQFSASQAAEAMGFMAMAGMNANEIVAALPDTLNLAAAAQLGMASAADIVTNILAGYGMETHQLAGAVDVLVAGFTNANTDLSQLAEAMKYAGPVANSAGVSFEEAAAAIAMMGNAGIQGSMAGTSLRGAITRLISPTERASNMLREAGVSATDAEGRLLPLADILEQLGPHAEDTGLFMEVFGQRAGPAMAALVSQGADQLRDLTHVMSNSGGIAEEVAGVQMQGLNGSLRLLKSAVEALMIAVAESGLIEWVTGMVTNFAAWIQRLSTTNPELLRLATIAAAVVAAIGPLLLTVGTIAKAFASFIPLLRLMPGLLTGMKVAFVALSGPVGIIIGLVGALVTAFATDFLGIRTAVTNQLERFGDAFSRWGGVISAGTEAAKSVFSSFRSWSTTFFRGLPEQFLNFGRDIVAGLRDGITAMFGNVRDTISNLAEGVTGWFKDLLGIESPSKVFHGYGLDIAQGLADGIDAGTPAAAAAAARLGDAVSTTMKAIVRGAMTPENLIGGLAGDADAIRARLEELRDTQFNWNTRAGMTPGTRGYVGNVIDAQIKALEDELKRLNSTLRETTSQNARAIDNQAKRFGLSVDAFAAATDRQALVALRYG